MKHTNFLLIFIFISISLFPAELIKENSDIKIHLVTLGPGDEIFLRWGHFGIIVDYPDDSPRNDIFFDYGTFSFKQEAFVKNFINGVMTYSKEGNYSQFILDYYTDTNRTIILQELNLTSEQKTQYIEKLLSEMRPENKYYQYDQYKNNCVTEMVTYLDFLLEGQFFKGSNNRTGRSFRDLSRDYVSSNYFYNLLIMFVLGSKVEYNITDNESLFLPDYAMKWADKTLIEDEAGNIIPLVKNKVVLNTSVGRDPVILNSKPNILLNLVIGILIAVISVVIGGNNKLKDFIYILTGTLLGFAGVLLFFMSFFTGHYYIHNNWNLIMINPLSFIIAIGSILRLIDKLKEKGTRMIQIYIDLTLIFTIAMLILKAAGLIYQQNGEIIALIVPALIVNSSLKLLIPGKTSQEGELNSL